MKRRNVWISMILVLALGLVGQPAAASHNQLRADMRKLWDEHVHWTRQFIISTLDNLPDRKAAKDRLLQNQHDIGNAIKPYYGEAAGAQLTTLLSEHIVIASVMVAQAKAGENARLAESKVKWAKNGDEIAMFLASANPEHWPAAEMKAMMGDHLATTTAELEALLSKDPVADAAAYARVRAQIQAMADMLSEGIIRQFPLKFR